MADVVSALKSFGIKPVAFYRGSRRAAGIGCKQVLIQLKPEIIQRIRAVVSIIDRDVAFDQSIAFN